MLFPNLLLVMNGPYENKKILLMMDILCHMSQSQFSLSFIFIKMKFYLLSFVCEVCNEVYQLIQ